MNGSLNNIKLTKKIRNTTNIKIYGNYTLEVISKFQKFSILLTLFYKLID